MIGLSRRPLHGAWARGLLLVLTLSLWSVPARAQELPPEFDPCRLAGANDGPLVAGDILGGTWRTVGIAPDDPRRLGQPIGVAVDSTGTVYVLDAQGARVILLNPEGVPLGQWGTHGAAPGELEQPSSITLDREGNVYVADTGNHRVQKLTPDGQPLAQWGSEGIAPGQFLGPSSVAVDSQGFVYVVDSGNTRVQKLAADGSPVVGWAARTYRSDRPIAVTIDQEDNVYVAGISPLGDPAGPSRPTAPVDLTVPSQDPGVTKLSPDGEILAHFGADSPYSPDFLFPNSVAVDPSGTIYATNILINEGLRKLSPSGEPIGQWPLPAAPDTPFGLHTVATDSEGQVYVAGVGNEVVRKYAPNGTPLAVWGLPKGTPGRFDHPSSVAVDVEGGYLYVLDGRLGNHLTQLRLDGEPLRHWQVTDLGLPANTPIDDLAVDSRGHVFLLTPGKGAQIVEMLPDGMVVGAWAAGDDGPGNVYFDRGLAVDDAGVLIVGGSHTHRIGKLLPGGTVLAALGAPGADPGQFNTPRGVAADDAGNIFVADSANHRVQKLSPSGEPLATWGSRGREPGQFLCPSEVAVDEEGRVSVLDASNERIQVFSADGTFLGQIGPSASGLDGPLRPAGLAADGQGGLFVLDHLQNRVLHVSRREGTELAPESPPSPPANADPPSDGTAPDDSSDLDARRSE